MAAVSFNIAFADSSQEACEPSQDTMIVSQHSRGELEMLVIAHRGASENFIENTLEAINFAADKGVDGIEIDIRRSVDGHFILFHDKNLLNIDGIETSPEDLSLEDLDTRLIKAGHTSILTLNKLLYEYNKKVPLIFDLKINKLHDEFIETLHHISFEYYLGVRTLSVLKSANKVCSKERILGLIPSIDVIKDFVNSGVGVIRLWEEWVTKDLVKYCHDLGCTVWVMTGRRGSVGETNESVLKRIKLAGVDGVLLNNIELMINRHSNFKTSANYGLKTSK